MAVGNRGWMGAAGHQSGDVRHVGHQFRAHLVGDGPEGGKVEQTRIGARAHDDQLRPMLQCLRPDLVQVDSPSRPVDAVVMERVCAPREVGGETVSQMTAVGQAHRQDRVTRFESRTVDGLVRRGARMRLDVGMLGTVQGLGPCDRQRLDVVNHLTAAVVALARVALGVLVGENAPHRLEHGGGREVLRSDELDVLALAGKLLLDQSGRWRGLRRQAAGRCSLPCAKRYSTFSSSSVSPAYHFQPLGIASTLEVLRHPDPQKIHSQSRADHPSAQAEHVGVVVTTDHARREAVAERSRPHPRVSVRGHGHARACPAHQHCPCPPGPH